MDMFGGRAEHVETCSIQTSRYGIVRTADRGWNGKMQKDDIINKIVFEVSKQYSGSENIVKNILIRELYQYDLVQKETAIVE